MNKIKKKLDKRAYTFMIVPHRGDKTYSFTLPIIAIKRSLAVVLVMLIAFAGFEIRQMFLVNQAKESQQELQDLRSNKDVQDEKLKQLATATENMQKEIVKVNQLEKEVRRSLDTDDKNVSRSGVERDIHSGQQISFSDLDADKLYEKVKQITNVAKSKQEILVSLRDQVIQRNAIRAATPSIWPAEGDVTSRYGGRNSPGGIGSTAHQGVDIAGVYGSPIRATADGTVEMATWYYGYGLYISIDHGYGIKTVYGHNSSLIVSAGQFVKKGQIIAYMGNTGVSTGTHVHYEVIKNGVSVNPANFL